MTPLLLRMEGRTSVCVDTGKWASQAEVRQSRGFDGDYNTVLLPNLIEDTDEDKTQDKLW